MTVDVRTMTKDDLALGMRLKSQVGWNQTETDWRRFLAMSPAGCFVGQLDGRAVGTIATFVFGSVAWIAVLLVEPEARKRGVGTAMMERSLAHLDALGVTTVRLDATPEGRPLYEKLGFKAQFELARYGGVSPGASPEQRAEAARRTDWDELCELDRAVTRTPRRSLLMRLFEEHPENVRVSRNRGRIAGFVSWRAGANAYQIGPCVATSHSAGSILLLDAWQRLRGKNVVIDVPLEQAAAVELVTGQGLTVQRPLLRIAHGAEVREKIESLWAGSGAEKG